MAMCRICTVMVTRLLLTRYHTGCVLFIFNFNTGSFFLFLFLIKISYRFCLDLILFSIPLKYHCLQFWRAILQEEVVERDGRAKVSDLEYYEHVCQCMMVEVKNFVPSVDQF